MAGIFGTLCSGGTLVLISEFAQKDVAQIADVICSRRISRTLCLPSLYGLLLGGYSEKHLDTLRNVVVAGEECSKEVVERHDRLLPRAVLTNEYGPTEGTVWATADEFVRSTRSRVPIGCPIPDVQVHIVDRGGNLSPIGFIGELYIGGEVVARGYLGRPDLTAARFLPDSFETDSYRRAGARLYRTGDQGHYLQDGLIEFLGRVDHQVKIRGFRVELSEIETVISRHPMVRKALVLAREDKTGEKRLVAYVVLHPGPVLSSREHREWLKLQLPDYMVPIGYVLLDEFPLTENGKLDRSALMALDPGVPDLDGAFIAPRGAVEEVLAAIWSGVLGIERVGVHDNFFELGGHSLLATQVIARIRESVGVELPLRLIFEEPTVAQLADRLSHSISGEKTSPLPPLKPRSERAYAPLTFAQQRLWFIDQLAPGNRAYNVPVALCLEGELRIDVLEKSLTEICRRHEALRTTFSVFNGKPCQVIHRAEAVALPLIDFCELGDIERREGARLLAAKVSTHAFDLTEYPLFRVLLVRTRPLEHILLFSTHHINSDGWSMGVLVREMTLLYTAYLNGEPPPLSEPPIQYADYAAWQREWLQGEVLERQKGYWLDQFEGIVPVLELPTDRPRPMIQGFRGARTFRRISPDLTKAVKGLSKQEGCTLFMTLLAAFGTLLSRYSSQDEVVIGTPIANRTQVEVENLIGLFANTLAIRIRPSSSKTYRELLAQTREATLGAYCHQDLPFELLVEQLRIERDLSHHPLFQVMFAFQNMPQEALQLPGLKMSLLTADSASAKFDLWLSIEESDDDLSAVLEYDTELFDGETIGRLLGHYCALLESATGNPNQRLGQIQILTEAERWQI